MDMIMHSQFMERPAVANSKVLQFLEVIDFEKLSAMVEPRIRAKDGRAGFPVSSMVKARFLGTYYNLSDRELEEELQNRADFGAFCGMYNTKDFPDHSTLCRFRNDLVKTGLLDEILDEINTQLEEQGLKIKEGSIAIVDATVIRSAARPLRKPTEEESREVSTEEEVKREARELSKDPDATFLKRGNSGVLGFKGYGASDEEGYIEKVFVRPANESEQDHFCPIADPKYFEGKRVYADKGSASKKNRSYLKENNMKSGIMYKAHSHHPLRPSQKRFNRLISSKRWRIEQCFGILKRKFNYTRARYMTLVKVNAEMLWKVICMNTLKATNKLAKQGG